MHTSLKPFNTFGIDAYADALVIAETAERLTAAWQQAARRSEPVLILGEGSNVLFTDDFNGTVILNRIMGISITESAEAWHLNVGSGENWHRLVEYTLDQGMYGLENLALIPGCVGASPVQNIGAYGIELRNVCEYVEGVLLDTSKYMRLSAASCRFGYRDSIFKHDYHSRFAITGVGLCLPKQWSPVLTYGNLLGLDPSIVTPRQVFDAVCHMRMAKIPNPKIQGNAGSFFKNPVISAEQAAEVLKNYPDAPCYPQPDADVTAKLAAGWLIDQCQLKGYRSGGAAVHRHQALVLINEENAISNDVLVLAHDVRQAVGKKFGIWLEPEVRFIGNSGEIDAVESIA